VTQVNRQSRPPSTRSRSSSGDQVNLNHLPDGYSSPQIKTLQKQLNLPQTGKVDKNLRTAVHQFQQQQHAKDKSFKVDNIVGKQTWGALKSNPQSKPVTDGFDSPAAPKAQARPRPKPQAAQHAAEGAPEPGAAPSAPAAPAVAGAPAEPGAPAAPVTRGAAPAAPVAAQGAPAAGLPTAPPTGVHTALQAGARQPSVSTSGGVTHRTGVDTSTYQVTSKSPSSAELAQISRTDRPLADAIRHSQQAFGTLADNGGRITVANSAGNGNYPVVTAVPPGFDASKPAQVQTHYHGWRASAPDEAGSGSKAMKQMMAANHQQVFVLPEAAGNVNANHTNWTNVSDEAATTRDALKGAGVTNVGQKTLSGHSAGGQPLATVLQNGHFDASRVVLLDCMYWPSQIKAGLQAHGQNVKDITMVDATTGHTADMARAFPGRVHTLQAPSHDGALRYYLGGFKLPSAN
jgi:hypothetical protein